MIAANPLRQIIGEYGSLTFGEVPFAPDATELKRVVVMAKTVRVRDGVPAVTDGPYLEAKEYLASFEIIDVESLDRALEVAAANPAAKQMQVEVWPILHESNPEG